MLVVEKHILTNFQLHLTYTVKNPTSIESGRLVDKWKEALKGRMVRTCRSYIVLYTVENQNQT